MPVDLRNLRCFLAVYATGSISRAAEHMHIAQPAMSMQVKGIEEDLGVRLFERTAHGVQATSAGERLAHHARRLLDAFDLALQDVRRLEATPSGRISIGLPQSMSKLLTVPLLRATLERWPQVQLQIVELSTGYIPEQLLQAHIDIGLTFAEHPHQGLRHEQIAQEKLVLIAPPGHFRKRARNGLSGQQVRFAELTSLPLVLPAPEHGLRILLERYATATQLQLRPIAEVNTIQQLIDVVASGAGCSLLSYAAVVQEVQQGRLSAAEVVQPEISRPVFMASRATSAPSIATSSLCNLLREIAQQLIAERQWPADYIDSPAP